MQLCPFQPRRFLPEAIDLNDPVALEPIFARLETGLAVARTAEDLQAWLDNLDEVDAALSETGARAYIAMTCKTDDSERERAFLHIITVVKPWLKPREFALLRALTAHPAFAELPAHFAVFQRSVANQVALYREENVPRQTEDAQLAQCYSKICGAMTVDFDGAELTLPEVTRVLEEPGRERREAAFRALAGRFGEDRETIEEIFDRMLAVRGEMARAAGFADYRDFAFAWRERFDYTPADCVQFHEAIERHVVPLRRQLRERRGEHLGVSVLKPWDIDVDPLGREPLRPFRDAAELTDKARALFAAFDRRMTDDLDQMERHGLLDLASRKGKAPGGYQETLAEARLPFIFMNAAGTQKDVNTFLHESGHAFHALAAREQRPKMYQHAPIEFCEVASMGMELLAEPYLDRFYDGSLELAARARRDHLIGVIDVLPWVATVDAFQHWLYTHPGHSRSERADYWMALVERFGGGEDWSDCAKARRFYWHRQLHFFEVPFYYVEYGIAQLGALQLWQLAREDQNAALEGYYRSLALGGSRPLPDLFAAAGLRFDFSEATLEPLMADVREALERKE